MRVILVIAIMLLLNVSALAEQMYNFYWVLNNDEQLTPLSSDTRLLVLHPQPKTYRAEVLPLEGTSRRLCFVVTPVAGSVPQEEYHVKGLVFRLTGSPTSWQQVRVFSGTEQAFVEKLKADIAQERERLREQEKLRDDLEAAIERLRRDARLIAGFDRIEKLQKLKASLGKEIEAERGEQEFLSALLRSVQRQEKPRNFEKRQEESVAAIKKLAALSGEDIDISHVSEADDGLMSEEEREYLALARDPDNIYLEELLRELENKRIKLERFFGYAPGEFELLQQW